MKKVLKNILCAIIFFIVMLINPSFADSSSANVPIIVQGLTPIMYSGGNWVDIDYMDSDWYDYENGSWANARTNNGDIYVWIPRFTYKIVDEEITIKWSDGKNDDISDGYLRHPAFYFGEYFGGNTNLNSNFSERNGDRNELTGFWLQKDLEATSCDISSAIQNSIKMTQDSSYRLPQSGTYTHVTKASEWGALAYLTKAKGYLTGTKTTLNQTGVNIGKSTEYVLGIKGSPITLSSGYKKYRDVLGDDLDQYLGFALSETASLSETTINLSDDSILIRGGELGLFGYMGGTKNSGYRTAISIIQEELTDTIAFFDTEASVVSGDYLILGVDFYVREPWKFATSPSNFFTILEELEDKKTVDMECIYEGVATWHQTDLNAQVIKLIKSDLSVDEVKDISEDTLYPAGKYTLVVRVGGKNNNENVFKSMDNMDVKIVVNELNLKNSSNEVILIDRIPNNKVRLNIYGEAASNFITKVVLSKVPSKLEYDLYEELDVSGGQVTVYFAGDIPSDPIDITLENVVNRNITSSSGRHLVDLQYNGMSVSQDDLQYIIDVSSTRQLVVNGEVKAGSITLNSHFKGPGKYSRQNNDVTKDLIAAQYLTAYKFKNWTSDSEDVKPANERKYSTTFTVPKRTAVIDKDEVTITANYIAPSRLEVRNPQTEFLVGDDFTIGSGSIVVIYPNDDGTEFERKITLDTPGVTLKLRDKSGNELNLDNLQKGFIDVTISFGEETAGYEIEVVQSKHILNVYIPSSECGEIIGSIKDSNGREKDTISIKDDVISAYKEVAEGRTVTLEATSKGKYVFSKWKVTGVEGLLSEEELTLPSIEFIMPSSDITIEAEFIRSYTITFKVKQGQEDRGTLVGTTPQTVLLGGNSEPVTAKASDNYGFAKWVDSSNKIVSQDETLICTYVTSDAEYTAVFDNVFTVKFYYDEDYKEDNKFAEIKVTNGDSGYISSVPVKENYVFVGWDKDLGVITSDVNTHALWVPRIKIEENEEYEDNMIDAEITGTMIEEGTMQYIISSSAKDPGDDVFTYVTDDTFIIDENGNWESSDEYYKNKDVGENEDASTILTILSSNTTEIVKFDYILSVATDSQLGITINGERVIGPDQNISSTSWNSFEKEIDVVDGKITLGLSYSQGEKTTNNEDFAAIRNLLVAKKWITIPNSYHLLIPVEFSQNYIHVKGRGSDDLTKIYTAVSDVFVSKGTILKKYTVTFNASGGSGSMYAQTFTEGISQELSANEFTYEGYKFMGWSTVAGGAVEYANKGRFIATQDTMLYAVWQEDGPTFVITAIANEGAIIEGVYTNHRCSECGAIDHKCEVANIFIEAENATVQEGTGELVITALYDGGTELNGVYTNHSCSECGGKDHEECNAIDIFIEAENAIVAEF